MRIGIISIAYDTFDFDKLYENVEDYFLPNHTKTFYFFTNKTEYIYKKNVNVYYSDKKSGLYTNIKELIKDVMKDDMQLLFFIGINNKFNIATGSHMMPDDDTQYTSLKDDEPMFFNLEALVDHIENNQDKMVYGSYLQNFLNLICYLSEIEEDVKIIKEEEEKELIRLEEEAKAKGLVLEELNTEPQTQIEKTELKI